MGSITFESNKNYYNYNNEIQLINSAAFQMIHIEVAPYIQDSLYTLID